ncbi:MAG: hypothetical protein LBS09_04190 [Bacteroidales bacterium]|nr:hypothetical protein [Bacteroidales bacterium]
MMAAVRKFTAQSAFDLSREFMPSKFAGKTRTDSAEGMQVCPNGELTSRKSRHMPGKGNLTGCLHLPTFGMSNAFGEFASFVGVFAMLKRYRSLIPVLYLSRLLDLIPTGFKHFLPNLTGFLKPDGFKKSKIQDLHHVQPSKFFLTNFILFKF